MPSRSQRHKVFHQGRASNGSFRAEGVVAGVRGAAVPTQGLGCQAGYNPQPTFALASISPTTMVHNTGVQTLTCTGTGFDNNDVVNVDGLAQTTTYVSATSLTAAVNSASLVAGTSQVTVWSGTKMSAQRPLTVT
jgi:hypothetical protein